MNLNSTAVSSSKNIVVAADEVHVNTGTGRNVLWRYNRSSYKKSGNKQNPTNSHIRLRVAKVEMDEKTLKKLTQLSSPFLNKIFISRG